jgi:hypothetical protein
MKTRQTVPVDGVFDIETSEWDQFVVGGLLDLRDGQSVYIDRDWRREDDFIDILLSFEGTLWAHNGGKFDVLWLLNHLKRRNLRASVGLQGSRVSRLVVGRLEIRDSYALIPMRLSDAAKIGGHEKASTGLRCICSRECGGYCAISRQMSYGDLVKLREYLRIDCEALASTLDALLIFCADQDLDLATTVGMAAWKTASRWLDIPDVEWGEFGSARYRKAREGYYGGRTQVFRPRAAHGFRYDINSAYPAALAITELPVGAPRMLDASEAARAYTSGKEGIYAANVEIPSQAHVPPLPIHLSSRTCFPVGRIRGHWTALELREAEIHGAVIGRFGKSLVWSYGERVLAPFCERVWSLRHTLGKKHPVAKWIKSFLNSCTGKLAQRPTHEDVFMNPDPDQIIHCPADGDCSGERRCGVYFCCKHKCSKKCGAWKPLDRNEILWAHDVYRMSPSGYVHWAAYLTASTRLTLLNQLTSDGHYGHTAVYCDTDSCYSISPRVANVGPELGQWDAEGTFKDFQALAPKTYKYEDQHGRQHVRAKGIPGADGVWDRISSGQVVTVDRGVNSFKLALREEDGNLFKRRRFERAVRADGVWFGDRKRAGEVTRPCLVSEVRE